MNKENKIVPEFRFPEFKNEGEWKEKVVSQLAEYENGKAHEQDINEAGKYVVVNSKFISTDGEVRKYTNSANCIAQKDDILMVLSDVPNGRAIAKCFIVDKHNFYTVNQRICKLTPTNADSKILYYLLNRNGYFLNFDDGVKQTNLRNEDVLNCPLVLPKNPKEQQKIASCLSSLDEVIAAHSQKLDLLKDHKKGLMQNLFPQEGEKVPKYRFKEFEKDGEWVEKKLGELAELTSSKRVHLADYVSSGVPFFRGKEISQLKRNQFPDDILYISNEQYKEIKDKYGVPKKGDILITAVGTLGNVYCIKNDDEFYFKDGNLIWLKNISIDSHFLDVLLDVEKEKVLASAIGSSQKALTMAALNKIKFQIPRNPKEQQKIASCLLSLDALIKAQAEKIEQLKLHKKGLMQGLFPKTID
jgi:type I restriction enzyme S subunit